jgi:hypothetical protein
MGGVFVTAGQTEPDGTLSVALNVGMYEVRLTKTGYTFGAPSALSVPPLGVVVLEGSASTVAIAPDPSLCVVFGTVRNAGGTPIAAAKVAAFASAVPQAVGGAQVTQQPVSTVTDADGYFELPLARGASVRFSISHTGVDTVLAVPDADSIDVTEWV